MSDPAAYEAAKRALQDAANDPDVTPDIVDGLIAIVEEYEASPQMQQESARASMSQHLNIGPTGLDALEQQLGPQSDDAGTVPPIFQGPAPHDAETKAEIAGQLGVAPPGPRTLDDFVEQSVARAETRSQFYDDSLPSASRRKDIFRPPEFIPPTPPVQELDPASILMGGLSLMPEGWGGKTQMFDEPGIDTFRRDMYPVLGETVFKLDESSPTYRHYADTMWQQAYDNAQAQGQPIVRKAFAQDPDHLDRAAFAIDSAGKAVQSGLHGVQELAFAGLPHQLEKKLVPEAAAMEERNAESFPAANTAGRIAGAVAPFGVGGRAAQVSQGVAKGLGLGRKATGALAGAVGAGAELGAEQAVDNAFEGTEMDAEPIIEGMLLGGGLGAAFGAIGNRAERLRARNRDAGHNPSLAPTLNRAEQAGAKLSLRGVEVPDDVRALRRRADQEFEQADPALVVASEMTDDYVAAGAKQADDVMLRQTADTQAYYSTPAGQAQKPVGTLLNRAMSVHRARSTADGVDVAMQESANGQLRRYINSMVERAELVDPHEAHTALAAARAKNPQAFRLTSVAEARQAGIDVDSIIRRKQADLARGGMDPNMLEVDDMVVVVTPQKYNARQLDETIDGVNRILKEGSTTGAPDPALEQLSEAARRVRDQFGPGGPVPDDLQTTVTVNGQPKVVKGWSAFKKQQEAEIEELQSQLSAAGLPRNPGRLTPEQRSGVVRRLASQGRPGAQQSPEEMLASRRLAGAAGRSRDLGRVRGLGAISDLEAMNRWRPVVGGGANNATALRAYVAPEALTLRLDALSEIMERPGRGVPTARGAAAGLEEQQRVSPRPGAPTLNPSPVIRMENQRRGFEGETLLGADPMALWFGGDELLRRDVARERSAQAQGRLQSGMERGAKAGDPAATDQLAPQGPGPGKMQEGWAQRQERTQDVTALTVEEGADATDQKVHNLFWDTLLSETDGNPTREQTIELAVDVFKDPETIVWFLNHFPDGTPKQSTQPYTLEEVRAFRPDAVSL